MNAAQQLLKDITMLMVSYFNTHFVAIAGPLTEFKKQGTQNPEEYVP